MRSKIPTDDDAKRMVYTRAMIIIMLDEMGVYYTVSTKEAVTRCIFHNDDPEGKPHLYINVDAKPGTYHCFRCGAKGVFSNYVQRATSWSYIKTMQYIIQVKKRSTVRSVDAGADLGDIELPNTAAVQLDEAALQEYDNDCAYFSERGLTDDTVARFRLGFDAKNRQVTLPWFLANGELLTVKRRNVDKKVYLYSTGADLTRSLYGLQLVRQHQCVWLVEGEFDALAMDQFFRLAHYSRHAVVALGGSSLQPSQAQALLRRQPEAVVLCFDNDEGGEGATQLAHRILVGSVRVMRAVYPAGCNAKDPDALTFEQKMALTNTVENQLDLRHTAESKANV